MVQVGAAVLAAGRTGHALVERSRVVGVAGVAQVDRTEAGERLSGAARAGRQHAVEQVDAARHRADADPPACPRPSGSAAGRPAAAARSRRACGTSPPAPRRPRARRSRSRRSRCRSARPPTRRAVRDARRPGRCRTARSPGGRRTPPGSAPPSASTGASTAAARTVDAEGRALVEDHGDVGVEQALDLDRPLRRERGGGCRRGGCGSRRRPRRSSCSPASDITW